MPLLSRSGSVSPASLGLVAAGPAGPGGAILPGLGGKYQKGACGGGVHVLLRPLLQAHGGQAGEGQGGAEGAHRSGPRKVGFEGGQSGEEDEGADIGADEVRGGGEVEVRREAHAPSAAPFEGREREAQREAGQDIVVGVRQRSAIPTCSGEVVGGSSGRQASR